MTKQISPKCDGCWEYRRMDCSGEYVGVDQLDQDPGCYRFWSSDDPRAIELKQNNICAKWNISKSELERVSLEIGIPMDKSLELLDALNKTSNDVRRN